MAFTRVLGPGIHTASNINSHNINSTGIITAVSFVGNGAGLTGIASTDNIITGTAATFNTYPVDINAGMDVVGVSSFQDIDVDGHTNLDNVSIAGVTTVTGMLQIPDGGGSGNRISIGDSEDLKIYHTGNESVIKQSGTGDLIIDALASGADIRLRSEAEFQVQVGGSTHIQVYKNGGVSFNQAGTGAGKKLETISTGARVTGTLDVTSGITVAGNIDANGDIDVAVSYTHLTLPTILRV